MGKREEAFVLKAKLLVFIANNTAFDQSFHVSDNVVENKARIYSDLEKLKI